MTLLAAIGSLSIAYWTTGLTMGLWTVLTNVRTFRAAGYSVRQMLGHVVLFVGCWPVLAAVPIPFYEEKEPE